MTRKNIRNIEKKIAKDAKQHPKKFWNYVNQKTKNKENIPKLYKDIRNKEEVTSDNQETANVLSEYFGSVFLQEPPGNWTLPENTHPIMNCDVTINEEIVKKLLKEVNPTKSAGPDGIHPRILHELHLELSKPLTLIFNSSLSQRAVPQAWKEANITAIHKKGDKRSASNYRPVSLTSVICKLMEKIIRKKIMQHLSENNILSNRQYGFISGRSTLLQLLKVLDIWTECLDRGSEVDVIFLDFQKAFDKVPHNRLLDKMKYYGFDGPILEWTRAFLKDRRQRVKIHDIKSSWSPVTSGIPQGSVLGPTLFIIYINSLPSTCSSETFLFADDAKLFREILSEDDHRILQADINKMVEWTKSSLLKFNAEKCSTMTITRPRSQTDKRNYHMNGIQLKETDQERDLGVIIDKHLKFEQHIQAKINKANSVMGIISRTYTYLDASTFLLLYKSLVRPQLEYCNQLWNPYLQKHIISIENVQRRAT
jgi:hypothetical protein